MSISEQQKTLLSDDVIFDFSLESGFYQPPVYSGVNFSFDTPIKANAADYNSPTYAFVDFSIKGDYLAPNPTDTIFSLEYVPDPEPPDGCEPDWHNIPGDKLDFIFSTCDDSPEVVGVDGDKLLFDFNCCPDKPPECEPDWVAMLGNAIVASVKSCEGPPDWTNQLGNAIKVSADCCGDVPPECEPDFINQPGNALDIDIISCDQNPDFINQPGNALDIDFDCCSNVPPVDILYINGNIKFDISLEGEVYFDPNTATVNGNIQLDQLVMHAEALRGENVLGITRLDELKMEGHATYRPTEFLVSGDIPLYLDFKGQAEYIFAREIEGDITLPLTFTGTGYVMPMIEGIEKPLDVIMEGHAESIVPTVTGNATIGPLIMEGYATWNEVPTVHQASITLDVSMNGELLYVDLPTVWGETTLDVKMESQPVIAGAHVYWANLPLSLKVEGELTFPQPIDGFYNGLGEIKIESEILAAMTGSTSVMSIGELKMNRGWIEYGPPIPPTIREMYEASNVRSKGIREYPIESKYPIYVPTTDYNIRDVQLRRGTLDYTIEFNFDAMQVDAVKVWIVDADGNARLDSVAKWLGGPTEDHILNSPFRYSLNIPVHCVNDKKYEFMLEVVYQDLLHNGSVSIERKSHYIPFQAHFDNRLPFANMTDRTPMIDANFDSIGPAAFETNSISFDPQTQAFEERGNVHLSNGLLLDDDLKDDFFELSMIMLDLLELNKKTGFDNSRVIEFITKYVELDVGQIGG